MEHLLSDTSKFQRVTFDPKFVVNKELRHILQMEADIKTELDDLLAHKYLSQTDYDFLNPVGSRPGILYGSCKVHKPVSGVCPPFRPILSAIGTSTYNLAKFFVPLLKEFTMNKHTVSDTFSFAEDIRKQDSNLYMTSFDVDSLFTNIPLNETINICLNNLYKDRKKKAHGLLKKQCRTLLEFATKKSFFLFNGIYYTQTGIIQT